MNCRFTLPSTGLAGININQGTSKFLIEHCQFTCNQAAAITATAGSFYQFMACSFLNDGIGHLGYESNSTAPALSAVNANVTNTSVVGNDIRGYIQFDVITGTIAAGSALFTVTPNTGYGAAPFVMITNEATDRSSTAFGVSGVQASSFVVRNVTALATGTLLRVAYMVMG